MTKLDRQPSAWHLEGRFLGFMLKDDKPKRMQLMTANGTCSIKLAKDIRASVSQTLNPGDWVQVWGETKAGYKAKVSDKTDRSLKAYKVSKAAPSSIEQTLPATPQETKLQKPAASATILICQKSDCMKRDSKGVCRALETALSDRGLTDQVTIRSTGCMKDCKVGPNVVFIPEKTRYSKVSARDAATLIDKQFPKPVQQESSEQTSLPSAI
ncbi:(2Fe-2S) ferredoxin domain-containing protein [Stenomitos frigidus]|uniref:(Fe-S)-binding protein n=1 Tax=Stenomitos frigidus ULC18 TaxID=2107698 RepID=A0A2T1ER93_9CYAN|nr:(2Fe-2S) ferredoxin domain-containing protein [Stenomitos frigidus]PSB35231.1 (Fe-S)-binding protein [Stenomitos frigidus ULC18]